MNIKASIISTLDYGGFLFLFILLFPNEIYE